MRCLRPIRLYNQSRFIVPTNRDQLVITCNCGKCANCQRNKFAEWSFRAYKHFEKCVSDGHYMLFDTLTYDDEHLPRLRDYEEFSALPDSKNHSCFNRHHIKLAMARLRRLLVRKGFGSRCFDYFLTSEYGSDGVYRDHRGRMRKATNRPHYHVLFYLKKAVPPLVFSRLVSRAWKYGRTDGVPYRPNQYVLSNVFDSLTPVARRKVNYVSKYVMKHSGYSKMIYGRVMSVLYSVAGVDLDWLDTDDARRLKRSLIRLVDSFHNQSCHFGLSALDGVDERALFEAGFFKMPNGKPSMFNRVPISNYFLRKLCYDKVTFDDGYECWSVKPDKKYLLDIRRAAMIRNAVHQAQADITTHGLQLDKSEVSDLIDYRYNYQGRYIADGLDVLEAGDRFDRARLFVYASVADKNHFGSRFVTNRYLGWKDNYLSPDGAIMFPLREFVEQNSFNECSAPMFNGYDGKLSQIDAAVATRADDVQSQFDHLQHLHEVFAKML